MKNAYALDDTLIRHSPAPFGMELLREVFETPDILILVDYEASIMRGAKLLTYMSNLDVATDIQVSPKLSKEERFELVLAYMEHRSIVGLQTLALTVSDILCAVKGIDEFHNTLISPILTKEEIVEFIETHNEVVGRWVIAMDSMVAYTMSINKKFVESHAHPKYFTPAVDDAHAVSPNFVFLFENAFFMELFYSVPGETQYYFVKQFEDYMFKGKNLFHFFMTESNPLPGLIEVMGMEEYDFDSLYKELEEFEEEIKALEA